MSEGSTQAFREMGDPSYLTSGNPGIHSNMVRCALFPTMEFSDRDELLTRVLTGWRQADETSLRSLIWNLVGGNRFLEMVSDNTSKQYLIEIYVSELFSARLRQPRERSPKSAGSRWIRSRQQALERYRARDDEIAQNQRRRERERMEIEAEDILEGRPDRSSDLSAILIVQSVLTVSKILTEYMSRVIAARTPDSNMFSTRLVRPVLRRCKGVAYAESLQNDCRCPELGIA